MNYSLRYVLINCVNLICADLIEMMCKLNVLSPDFLYIMSLSIMSLMSATTMHMMLSPAWSLASLVKCPCSAVKVVAPHIHLHCAPGIILHTEPEFMSHMYFSLNN